jgi:hypothetical protein
LPGLLDSIEYKRLGAVSMKKSLPFVLLFFAFLVACVPAAAPAPTSTADDTLSAAVATTEKFYTLINAAQNQDELGRPWGLLSLTEQCNPRDGGCDLSYFQAAWWPSQVLYRVFTCGSDQVVAEQRLYPRGSDPASAGSDSKYIRFEFSKNEDGALVINKRSTVDAPGAECKLVVDGFKKP